MIPSLIDEKTNVIKKAAPEVFFGIQGNDHLYIHFQAFMNNNNDASFPWIKILHMHWKTNCQKCSDNTIPIFPDCKNQVNIKREKWYR